MWPMVLLLVRVATSHVLEYLARRASRARVARTRAVPDAYLASPTPWLRKLARVRVSRADPVHRQAPRLYARPVPKARTRTTMRHASNAPMARSRPLRAPRRVKHAAPSCLGRAASAPTDARVACVQLECTVLRLRVDASLALQYVVCLCVLLSLFLLVTASCRLYHHVHRRITLPPCMCVCSGRDRRPTATESARAHHATALPVFAVLDSTVTNSTCVRPVLRVQSLPRRMPGTVWSVLVDCNPTAIKPCASFASQDSTRGKVVHACHALLIRSASAKVLVLAKVVAQELNPTTRARSVHCVILDGTRQMMASASRALEVTTRVSPEL